MSEARKKGKVVGNSILYTLSAVLSKAVSFIMMPIYTNFISTEQYGIYRVINNFTNVAVYIVGMSLYSALVRFTSQYKHDKEKQKKLYGSVFVFLLAMGVICFSLCLLFRDLLDKLIFEGIPFFPYVIVGLVALEFRCQEQAYTSLLQGRQEGKKLLILHAISCVFSVILNLFLIFVCKLEGISLIITILVQSVLYTVVMLVDLLKRGLITFGFDREIMGEALKYSVPLIPHHLSSHIATLASTIILKNKKSLSTVGLYNVASSFSVVIDTVQAAVNRAFMPWFFDTMDQFLKDHDPEAKKSINTFTSGILILYSIMYLGVGLFAQEFVLIFTAKSYALSWVPVPILVGAYSVKSVYYMYMDVLLYYKKPSRWLWISTVAASLLNIILAAYLTEPWGMYGIAFSFMAAKFAQLAIVYWTAKPYIADIGYNFWNLIKVVLLSLVFIGMGLIFSYTKYQDVLSLPNLCYKILIFAIYLFIVYKQNPERAKKMINLLRTKLGAKLHGKTKGKGNAA